MTTKLDMAVTQVNTSTGIQIGRTETIWMNLKRYTIGGLQGRRISKRFLVPGPELQESSSPSPSLVMATNALAIERADG